MYRIWTRGELGALKHAEILVFHASLQWNIYAAFESYVTLFLLAKMLDDSYRKFTSVDDLTGLRMYILSCKYLVNIKHNEENIAIFQYFSIIWMQ